MPTFARDNLLRLMAADGLSLRQVIERTGLNARTVQGILRGSCKPHARTLHRLSQGLGVSVEEFFIDPAQLLYRRFDRRACPAVAEIVERHREMFAGWTETDFNELHRQLESDGPLTDQSALEAVQRLNRKRELHGRLDLLLESPHADLAAGVLDVLFEKVVDSG